MADRGEHWRLPAAVAGALALIYLLGTGAVWFTSSGSSVAFWWPAAGLSVAMVAIAPRRWWPLLALGIVVVSGAANLSGGRPLPLAVGFSLANAAEAVTAGLLLKGRNGRLLELADLTAFVRLVRATLAGALVIGIGAATTAVLFDDSPFWEPFRNVLTSHATATLVIVPVAMTWRLRTGVAGAAERMAQMSLLVATVTVIFVPEHQYPVTFAIYPLMVWAALRLTPRTVALELLATCVSAILLTARDHGPLGAVGPGTTIPAELAAPLVQGFILATVLVSLPLTVAISQHGRVLGLLAERERLFRRNFTDSLTGMLLLARRGDRLVITDANDTARDLLDDGTAPVVGRFLDRVLAESATLQDATQSILQDGLDGWRGQAAIAHLPGTHVDIAISPLSRSDHNTFSAQLLDVTPLLDALARTEAAERLTGATLDTAGCMILLTDLSGTVIRVNHATSALTRFREDQIVGHPLWTTLVPTRRVPAVKRMFSESDGSAIPREQEADVQTASGEVLRVVWRTALVNAGDRGPRYAVLTGVDVTAERTTAGLMATLFQAGITTAIIGIDARGQITLVNSGGEALLATPSDSLTGTPFTDLLDPEELAERTLDSDGTGWSALTSTLGAGHESQLRDWTWLAAGGVRRTVSMTISGGRSAFGPQAGYLVVGRDVTEERHSQMMLMAALEKERLAADRLRQLDSAKNDFVSTVSHELRTPVTSIVGYTEMLADGTTVDPDPEQLPLLGTIARNGQRLITMCNDLLTLAGLDTGGSGWDLVHVDLREQVRQGEDSLRPLLRDRELTAEFEVPDHPVPVLGDAIQLERVVLNLLSNAVKFTPDGGRVTTSLESNGGEACLVVADTGIGIPTEEQDALFQRFFRASTAQHLAIQGTGLGLSIVAGIVAAHGGRISVESEPGRGTVFTVGLPLLR